MNNKQRLFEIIGKIDKTFKIPINEAQAVPFTFRKKNIEDVNKYDYIFEVNGVKMQCNIWHDDSKHYDGIYEVSFGEIEKGDYHRVGKDLTFMNTVLETVAACINDFLNKEKNVTKLLIEGSVGEGEAATPWDKTVRSKAYLRFIKNKFPNYDVKDFGRYIQITVRENVENQREEMKNIIKSVSDIEEIPEHGLQGHYTNEQIWSIETDFGVNSKIGQFTIEVDNDFGNYEVSIKPLESGEETTKYFDSFEDAKTFIINYFK